MPARIVRAHYDELTKIASAFGQQADLTRKTLQDLRTQQEALQGGDWVGNGAQAFYAEMNSQIVPTINRLVQALQAADQTTAQIREMLHQAENEAAHILHANGNGNGSAAGAAAAGLAGAADLGGALGGNGGSGAPSGMSSFVGGSAPTAKPTAKPAASAASPLTTNTRPLPSAAGVKTYGDLVDKGQRVPGSQFVDRWGKDFSQKAPALQAQQAKLDDAKAVLAETMKEQGAALTAARQNLAAIMDKLNKASGGKAYALVKEYEQRSAQAKTADLTADGAAKAVEAAQQRVEAVKAAANQFEAGEAKKGWEAKRDEIKAAVEEREKLFDKVAGVVKAGTGGDPKGVALDGGVDLVKMVVTGMSNDEIRAMAAAEANIAQQDEIMTKAAERVLHEQAGAAKSDLEAANIANRVAQTNAVNAEKAQRDTLDQLAALEREHGGSHVFRELKAYDDQVRTVGEQVRSQANDYAKTLRNPPYSDAGQLARAAGEDIHHVEVYGGGNEAWFDNARGTQRYLDQVARWQQGEMAADNQLRQDLAQGKHLGMVDDTIRAADKAMGGNPNTDDLVRKAATR